MQCLLRIAVSTHLQKVHMAILPGINNLRLKAAKPAIISPLHALALWPVFIASNGIQNAFPIEIENSRYKTENDPVP